MSRKVLGLKNPERFLIDISPVVAEKLRHHCFVKGYFIGRVIEQALVDYLIKERAIDSREALEIEEQMTK